MLPTTLRGSNIGACEMDEHEYEQSVLEFQDRIATMSDAGVRTAYLASEGLPGLAWTDTLARAMKDRKLDV
jgi:hypothetical protein